MLRRARVGECLDRIPQCGEHEQDVFDLGDLKHFEHPPVHSSEGDSSSRFGAGGARAHQRSEPGRIKIGYSREIQNPPSPEMFLARQNAGVEGRQAVVHRG